MNQALSNEPDVIAERILAIKFDLNAHRRSITTLYYYAEKARQIRVSTQYAPRVIKYSMLPRSEARFYSTIQNLKIQVELLELELKTLMKYCAYRG
jgi:hypothetical protein